MYILSRLKDTIRIEPSDFGKDRETALRHEINKKYANKVLPNVGLCIAVFEIDDCAEGIILQGDGSIFHKVIFRMVMFKPFVDEVLLAKISKSTKEGIKFSLGFFDDCWIPRYRLPAYCAFDPSRSEFYWVPPADDDDHGENIESTPEEERFYIIAGHTIRVRITGEFFHDTTPKVAPKPAAGPGAAQAPNPAPAVTGPPPYRLEASIQEPGLGLLDWWIGSQEEVEELAEAMDNAE